MRLSILLLALTVFCAPVVAQGTTSCSTLTLTGTIAPGATLDIDVTGATADAFTLLAVGQTLGTTTMTFGPLGTLMLDLDAPFAILPFGFTDTNGDVSRSISIPASANPNIPAGTTIHMQSVTVDFSFSFLTGPTLNFCTSNVATLVL